MRFPARLALTLAHVRFLSLFRAHVTHLSVHLPPLPPEPPLRAGISGSVAMLSTRSSSIVIKLIISWIFASANFVRIKRAARAAPQSSRSSNTEALKHPSHPPNITPCLLFLPRSPISYGEAYFRLQQGLCAMTTPGYDLERSEYDHTRLNWRRASHELSLQRLEILKIINMRRRRKYIVL